MNNRNGTKEDVKASSREIDKIFAKEVKEPNFLAKSANIIDNVKFLSSGEVEISGTFSKKDLIKLVKRLKILL
jgi:hypothetical protein